MIKLTVMALTAAICPVTLLTNPRNDEYENFSVTVRDPVSFWWENVIAVILLRVLGPTRIRYFFIRNFLFPDASQSGPNLHLPLP